MRLIAFGGDERMRGALLAAGRAGWETLHIEDAADVPDEMPPAQAVMLPWPRSFREERLISAKVGLERERVLALIPACRARFFSLRSSRNSPAAAAEERIFPFRIMLTPGYAHFIPIPNPVRQFWLVNLFFTLLLLVVKRLNRCRLTGAFHLVDLALTAVFGIYGFIAVLIFPNRS